MLPAVLAEREEDAVLHRRHDVLVSHAHLEHVRQVKLARAGVALRSRQPLLGNERAPLAPDASSTVLAVRRAQRIQRRSVGHGMGLAARLPPALHVSISQAGDDFAQQLGRHAR